MKEVWKSINGEEHYQVSDHGRVRSLDRIDSLGRKQKGRILKNTLTKQGYLQVAISGRTHQVGKLVLETFVGERPKKHLVHYADGDLQNVHLDNLSWSIEPTRTRPVNEKCIAPSCVSEPRNLSADYCEMHYYRLRRNGTLDTVAPYVPETECWAEGCANPAFKTNGLCRNCHLRRERNGTFAHHGKGELHPFWLTDDKATYTAVHHRIRELRGSAKEYQCADCGNQAKHWSYNHDDPNERRELVGKYTLAFSTDLTCYSPRCVRCHKKHDMELVMARHGA